MNKKYIVILILLGMSRLGIAQFHEDVLRYSRTNYQGSVRSMGLAGAWGAVGADLSSASINPAGLALYRRNEVMASMAINTYSASTKYGGSEENDFRTGFNIPNLGLVVSQVNQYKGKSASRGLVNYNFAFGLNRLSDYQQNIRFEGQNRNSTVGDYLARAASGRDSAAFWDADYDNTLSALAWRLSLIDNFNSGSNYASVQKLQGDTNYFMNQLQEMKLRGRMQEWYVSGAMNISNMVYLGASIVFQDVNYTSTITYKENLTSSNVQNNYYIGSTINQYLNTKGSGAGAKLGVIFRPLDFIRVGATWHTPVILRLTDYYRNSMSVTYSDGKTYSEPYEKREDYFEYSIRTPGRYSLSACATVLQNAVLSVDYEQIDFSKGEIRADGYSFSTENARTRTLYGQATNIRGGLEVKAENLRFRAGYALLGSPYKEDYIRKEDGNRQMFSAGFGWIQDQDYFFDLGVNYIKGKELYSPYDGAGQNGNSSFNRIVFAVGAGVRF